MRTLNCWHIISFVKNFRDDWMSLFSEACHFLQLEWDRQKTDLKKKICGWFILSQTVLPNQIYNHIGTASSELLLQISSCCSLLNLNHSTATTKKAPIDQDKPVSFSVLQAWTGRGQLGASVRDDVVWEAMLAKNVLEHGDTSILKNCSTTEMMVVCPADRGRHVTKSMDMWDQGCLGTKKELRKAAWRGPGCLLLSANQTGWHEVPDNLLK